MLSVNVRVGCLCMLAPVLFGGAAQAQDRSVRIFGVGYPTGTDRPDSGDVFQVPVRISADGRHARFPLQITVRNDENDQARFKLQVVVNGARPMPVTSVYTVSPGEVRQVAYNLDADFASGSEPASPGGVMLSTPTPIIVLPTNPVRAEIRLYTAEGTELDRRPFEILLRDSPRTLVRRFDRDLLVENAAISVSRRQPVGGARIVTASAVISNNGSMTWGYPGNISFELQRGTPETGLETIGAPGMPTARSLPLPRGLAARGIDTVTARLTTRLRSTGPIRGGEIIRVDPPLRAGVWYTLTVATSSPSDLDASNDSVQLVFMVNDDMSMRESRLVPVTNRVRVVPAR
jgi:hypothetical protein